MDERILWLGEDLLSGALVDTGHWQSLKGVPQTKTVELMNVYYYLHLPDTKEKLQAVVEPNLPWAEEQFQERVGGVPLNPGESFKLWPWYRPTWESQKCCDSPEMEVGRHIAQCRNCGETWTERKFSHTYMERFWPRYAWCPGDREQHHGIRYRYGDLNDVVALLAREPYTRQAYLPVFFPEDTGAHHGERVPCTLGYHFLLREGKLHINYFIRSCDFLRHFRDDVYLAGRLCQWMIERLRGVEVTILNDQSNDVPEPIPNVWHEVQPGTLTMFISSLHVFEGDLPKVRREYG